MTAPRLTPATKPATTGTATCQYCGQLVPLGKVALFTVIESHIRRDTGKSCDGGGMVIW